ncbi:MAG: hypothetical protein J5J06_18945 [Phycisphaerae bacterium]|nr:hypothetical protein [Phycisphaerae bacterium]
MVPRILLTNLLVLLSAGPVVHAEQAPADSPPAAKRFDDYIVARVNITSKQQYAEVEKIIETFWSEHPGIGSVEVVVRRTDLPRLRALGLDPQTLIENLQALIDAERPVRKTQLAWFDDYHDYNAIVTYLNQLAAAHPTLAQVIPVGTTWEGRTIWGIRIAGANQSPFAPSVIYFSSVHAREWIAATVPQYVATYLLDNYGINATVTDLVDNVEWILIPVGNPDGYVYTWTSYRLWRKNRRNNGDGSFGVDINRNWGYEWGGAGTSPTPSDDTYRGPSAFSEPETQALRDLFLANPQTRAQLDIHSYSQLILWPWGFTSELPPDQVVYSAVGLAMQQLIQGVHGVLYTAGPIYTTIYPASGGSLDWTYAIRNVLSFSYELRPASSNPGFVLPPDQIIPNNEEILPAILHLTGSDWVRNTVFNFHDGLPTTLQAGSDIPVAATVTSADENLNASSATMYYRYDPDAAYTAVPMIYLGGPSFTATLPATNCLSQPQYYFSIDGDNGTTTDPASAPAVVHTASMTTGNVVFYTENLDTNPGWSTQGQWAYGTPTGGGGEYGSPDPTSGHTGPSVYGYNLSGDYTNNMGEQHLTSAPINCSGRSGVRLRFWRWLGVETSEYDEASVRVSTNGSSWTTVWQNSGEIADSVWTPQEIDISAIADNQPTVYLRWTMGPTDVGWHFCGWNIDDISLTYAECTVVYGDSNGDQQVNQSDYNAFAPCYTGDGVSPVPPGCAIFDFNADNDVDCGDFASFAGAWTEGGDPPTFAPCSGGLLPPKAATAYPHGALKNRYVSFVADPLMAGTPHGYRVRHVPSGIGWFISTPRTTPAAIAGEGLTYLVADAAPPMFDFATMPTIHVGGCMIAPGSGYEIATTLDGVIFSAPLDVATAPVPSNGRWWADVTGTFSATGDNTTTPPTPAGAWTPPNGQMSGLDITALVQTFASPGEGLHITWGDLNGEQLDRTVNGPDILQAVNAFSTGSGREFYPFSWPGGSGPQGQPACPDPPFLADLTP